MSADYAAEARRFRALGDEQRLRIVALLAQGELCVCHLEALLEAPQPTVSRQLASLKAAGLVEARRAGSWVHYRLAPSAGSLRALVRAYATDAALKRTVTRVVTRLGPGACR